MPSNLWISRGGRSGLLHLMGHSLDMALRWRASRECAGRLERRAKSRVDEGVNSRYRVAHATTHDSMISDQADSEEASRAIHDVVEAERTAPSSLTRCRRTHPLRCLSDSPSR